MEITAPWLKLIQFFDVILYYILIFFLMEADNFHDVFWKKNCSGLEVFISYKCLIDNSRK